MIRCPECGQNTDDDARFCERCGQGLASGVGHQTTTSIASLAPDTELRGLYRVTALIGSTALENRYRAIRITDHQPVQLRERARPLSESDIPGAPEATAVEDPAGPRAKTAELRLDRLADSTSASDSTVQSLQPEPADDASDRQHQDSTACSAPAPSGDEDVGLAESADQPGVHLLTEAIEEADSGNGSALAPQRDSDTSAVSQSDHGGNSQQSSQNEDLGDVFGRVLALSMTLDHPAFQRAIEGFVAGDRVYLVYPDEELEPLSRRPGGLRMDESEALRLAIQICQAVSFVHRRGLRVNDICPDSVAYSADHRVKLTGLDYISNDDEVQSEPIFNDGYTAPEIYRGKKADKRADIFSIGALLYSCITGERLDSESWREESGPIRFYPPHLVSPALERALRRAVQFDPAARWPNVDTFKNELVKLANTVCVQAAALTDVGRVREHNEDSVLAFECMRDSLVSPKQTFLYAVADGMGGAEAGEVASAIAVQTIQDYVEKKLAASANVELSATLQEALEQANSKIVDYQASHPETRSMGSTAVAALIIPPQAAIAWVGDSRAYIFDDRGLRQLTKDHSLVQRLIEIGQISPEEARHHEHKNVITRSLGARATGPAGAESISMRLRRGDRLLLCSDGLTTHVEDGQIEEILRRNSDSRSAALELVVAANAGGGTDNISVVVVTAH
jgi:serine/threonine protein phosphatase PrpC